MRLLGDGDGETQTTSEVSTSPHTAQDAAPTILSLWSETVGAGSRYDGDGDRKIP